MKYLILLSIVLAIGCAKKPELIKAGEVHSFPSQPPQDTEQKELIVEDVMKTPRLDNIQFLFDSYDLKPAKIEDFDLIKPISNNTNILSDLAFYLKHNESAQVVLNGHACEVGTENYNMELSQHRANIVKEYLMSKGIEAERIITIGNGEYRPIGGDVRFDRRVEIIIK